MTNINELKENDFIAFPYNYGIHQGEGGEIVVDCISKIQNDKVLVHFLYGYKSEAEWVNKSDILAIGNMKGKSELKGWTGKFDILKPSHPLIKKSLKS